MNTSQSCVYPSGVVRIRNIDVCPHSSVMRTAILSLRSDFQVRQESRPRGWDGWTGGGGWGMGSVPRMDAECGYILQLSSMGAAVERSLEVMARVARDEESSSRIRACRRGVTSRVRPVLRARASDNAPYPIIKARGTRARARVLVHPRAGPRAPRLTSVKTLAAAAGERRSSTHVTHRRGTRRVAPREIAVSLVPAARWHDYQQVSRARARPVGIVDDPRPPVRSVRKTSYIPPLTLAPYIREKL